MSALVRADGAVTRVKVDADLDAAAVEGLIADLMACRAAMAPRRLPVMFAGSRIAIGSEGALHVQREADGRTLLALHHPGFGWFGARVGQGALAGVTPRRPARGGARASAHRPAAPRHGEP